MSEELFYNHVHRRASISECGPQQAGRMALGVMGAGIFFWGTLQGIRRGRGGGRVRSREQEAAGRVSLELTLPVVSGAVVLLKTYSLHQTGRC